MLRVSPPPAALEGAWNQALAELESRIGADEVHGWLRSACLQNLEADRACVLVPTDLHEQKIRKSWLPQLCAALGVAECVLKVQPAGLEREPDEAELPPARPRAPAAEAAEDGTPLNPDYTFEHYVVGPCNRFAHAAARGVADRPATAFNPLFLHGPVGVGKTHLMQAIAHQIVGREPGLTIAFLSCEQFVNHFIRALQHGDVERFRNRYRLADVLVVDDIHLLANKARTQEEFFHTFNTLHNARKQIVLSSDSPPQDIPALQERLVSRFNWGLVAEIEPTCFETRVAILHAKAARVGQPISPELARFLAENVHSNVRQLEGTLTRLLALSALTNQPLTLDLAREVLRPPQRAHNHRAVRMDDILAAVTGRYGVKVADLQSKRRTQSVVFPRQVAMYLARSMTRLSLEEIGGYFGGRDHSTVLYALERVEERRRVDSEFGVALADLERELRGRAPAA